MKVVILTGNDVNKFAAALAKRLSKLNVELFVVVCVDYRSLLKGLMSKIKDRKLVSYIRNDISESLSGLSRKLKFTVLRSRDVNSKRTEAILKDIHPDVAIQAGVGIIRKRILCIPTFGIINAHMALLPKYRGMNVLEWSLLCKDPVGVTAHLIDEGIDTGDILLEEKIILDKGDTIDALRAKAERLSVELLAESVCKIKDGSIKRIKQIEGQGEQYFVMHPRLKDLVEYKLNMKVEYTEFSLPYIVYAINEAVLGRATLGYLKKLKIIEKYPAQELKQFQFEGLKRLLLHAYGCVDYYRDVFGKAGFDPEKMASFEDFNKVPFLTKEDIRSNQKGFISKDKKRKLTRYATSGSTGHPLKFYLSNERIASNKAAYLMLYAWWGLKIGDREVVLWSSSRDLMAYNFIKKIRDRLLNTRLFSAFQMSEDTMYKYAKLLQSYRPKDIFGYAHSIYILARLAKNRNLRLNDLGLKVVFTTAELLHDYQRKVIEEVFGCPVCNCYGGRESGLVAFECPKGNMHLNPLIYAEFINNDIIITDLYSYGMPFIRYKTGDQGILSDKKECPCGISFPIVEKIMGRDTDYVVGPKGEFIHPLALEYIFRESEDVDYFRIVQKKEDELVIDLLVTSKFDKRLEQAIRDKIDLAMGGPVKTGFKYIKEDEIPQHDKYKFVISEVINKYI
jgi:phenylacetate-CoA ligase